MTKLKELLKKIAAYIVAIFSGYVLAAVIKQRNKKNEKVCDYEKKDSADIVNNAINSQQLECDKSELKNEFRTKIDTITKNFFGK